MRTRTGNHPRERREWITRDVEDIANDRFFNTPEAIETEVQRRIDGVKLTYEVVAKLDRRQRC